MPVKLLRAGPGGGKTSALLDCAATSIKAGASPARILFVTHDATARARAALDGALGRPLPVATLTYEDLAQRILEQTVGHDPSDLLDPLAERLLVAEAVEVTHDAARALRQRDRAKSPDEDLLRSSPRFRDDVADFIAELKRCKLDRATFRKRIIPGLPQRDELLDIADIYDAYQEWLESARLFDYRGIIWSALIALEADPAFAASLRGRYDLVLADDLQDATALQLELLIALLGEHTRLVGAYEPEQCIYRFRGAIADPLPLLKTASGDHGHEVLVERIAPSGGSLAALHTQLWACRTPAEELERIGDAVIELLEAGTEPATIAVVARGRADVMAARQALTLRGVPTAAAASRQGQWVARRLIEDAFILHEYSNARPAPAVGGSAVTRRRLEDANDAAARIVGLCGLSADLGPEVARSRREASRHGRFLLEAPGGENGRPDAFAWLREAMTGGSTSDAGKGCGSGITGCLLAVLSRLEPSPTLPPADVSAMMNAALELIERLRTAERHITRITNRALDWTMAQAVLQMAGAGPAVDADGVALLTVHETRGRSFDHVFLFAVNEDSFPAPAAVSRLLKPATFHALRSKVAAELPDLAASLTFAGFGELPEESVAEERRLFSVAITRARRQLVVSCHLERDTAPAMPSLFFMRLLPDGFTEDLSRVARAAPETVVCALGDRAPADDGKCGFKPCPLSVCPRKLDRLAARQDGPRPTRAPGRRNRTGPPVLAEPEGNSFVLSASALRDYQTCPRRFYFARLLRLDDAEGDAVVYGSAIHSFLRELYSLPTAERNGKTAEAQLTKALEAVADQFSSQTAYRIALRRGLEALMSMVEMPEFHDVARGVEPAFGFHLTDDAGRCHRFVGRIDAVLDGCDGVVLVDHKSGSMAEASSVAKALGQFIARDERKRASDDRRHWELEPAEPDYQLALYALAWERQTNAQRLNGLAYQRFAGSAQGGCRRVTVKVADGCTGDETSITRAELEQIAEALGKLAREIKQQSEFEGRPPREGCSAMFAGCPFAIYCDQSEI